MKELKIEGGVLLLDDRDFDRISKYKWKFRQRAIIRVEHSYTRTKFVGIGSEVLQHYVSEVDHVDRNPFNSQRYNLRPCTDAENARNRRKVITGTVAPTSKYKGVRYVKSNASWRASLTYEGNAVQLGYYNNEINAAIAYNMGAFKYFKEFANYNPLPTVFSI